MICENLERRFFYFMLIDELNKANMEALKNRDKDGRAVLSVVISKYKLQLVEMKAAGKEIGDPELISIINKTVKELNDEQAEYASVNNTERVEGLERQKQVISQYLPKMLSEEEIRNIIAGLEDKSVPAVMKHFKTNYAGKVDMGLVNKCLR